MRETFELANPITIDGVAMDALEYDFDEITITQFAKAEAAAKKVTASVVAVAEFDYTFHFYLAAAAVVAVNPGIDIMDLERIRGRDVVTLVDGGRFFMMRSEGQGRGSSDGPSETTPASTRPAQQTSTECA